MGSLSSQLAPNSAPPKVAFLSDVMRAALTPRQGDIAELLLCGLSDPEIAHRLGIDVRSVKGHLRMLFLRFGVGYERGAERNKRIVLARRLQCL